MEKLEMGKLEILEARSFSTPSWPPLRPQVLLVIKTVKALPDPALFCVSLIPLSPAELVTHKQKTPQLALRHIKTQQPPNSLCQKFSFIPIPRNPIFSRWSLHSTYHILSVHSYGNLGRGKLEGETAMHPKPTACECHRCFQALHPHTFQLCWNMSLRCHMLPGHFPELPEVRGTGWRRNI